jgi:hypothetical protein
MNRLLLASALGLLALGWGSNRADFSGTWKLNMKSSKGLPSSFAMVKGYTMEVAQSSDSLVIHTELAGPDGAVKFPPTVVKYDGPEVYREDTLRGSKRWISAGWTTTGQKLIVTNRVIQRRSGAEQHYTQTDVWQFGKRNTLLLLVTQKFEDSTHSEQRTFTRVR